MNKLLQRRKTSWLRMMGSRGAESNSINATSNRNMSTSDWTILKENYTHRWPTSAVPLLSKWCKTSSLSRWYRLKLKWRNGFAANSRTSTVRSVRSSSLATLWTRNAGQLSLKPRTCTRRLSRLKEKFTSINSRSISWIWIMGQGETFSIKPLSRWTSLQTCFKTWDMQLINLGRFSGSKRRK